MSALAEALIVVGIVGTALIALCAATVFAACVIDIASRMRPLGKRRREP